jgi:hypothetical protein
MTFYRADLTEALYRGFGQPPKRFTYAEMQRYLQPLGLFVAPRAVIGLKSHKLIKKVDELHVCTRSKSGSSHSMRHIPVYVLTDVALYRGELLAESS